MEEYKKKLNESNDNYNNVLKQLDKANQIQNNEEKLQDLKMEQLEAQRGALFEEVNSKNK